MQLILVWRFFGRLFYHLTAYLPRRLPATELQLEHFKRVMTQFYGLPDEPQVWVLVSGQITSTPSHRLRKAWGHIANSAKRININKLSQEWASDSRAILKAMVQQSVAQQVDFTKQIVDLLRLDPARAAAIVEGTPEAAWPLADKFMEANPGMGDRDDWTNFVRSVAVQDKVNRASEVLSDQAKKEVEPGTDAVSQPIVSKDGNA